MDFLRKFDEYLDKATGAILILAMALILGLTLVGIVSRWFSMTFHWLEPLVRHIVLLSVFLGGVLATGRNQHIGIDLIPRALDSNKNIFIRSLYSRLIALTSLLISLWLLQASWEFTLVEAEYGRPDFLGIHTKFLVGIIPFGLAPICLRFLIKFILGPEAPKAQES